MCEYMKQQVCGYSVYSFVFYFFGDSYIKIKHYAHTNTHSMVTTIDVQEQQKPHAHTKRNNLQPNLL